LYFSVENPVPQITSLSPSSTIAGSAAFTMTIDGSNFVNASQALWNGEETATAFLNANRLQATISAENIRFGAEVGVTVVNPGPGGGASNTKPFFIQAGGRIYLPIVLK